MDTQAPEPRDPHAPSPDMTVRVTLDRTSAALAVGELLILAQSFEPIDGQYAARLQAVCDAITKAMSW